MTHTEPFYCPLCRAWRDIPAPSYEALIAERDRHLRDDHSPAIQNRPLTAWAAAMTDAGPDWNTYTEPEPLTLHGQPTAPRLL